LRADRGGSVNRWPAWLAERFYALSPARRAHSERVAALGEVLAYYHGLSPELARLAGLAHDLAREWPDAALLREAERWAIDIGPLERRAPVLLHGPVAAAWLREAGIGGAAVFEAVRYHTTAGPGLGPLAKAIFVADGCEPGRQYPEAATLRALAFRDLEDGYRAMLEASAAYLRARGLPPHPAMLAALDEAGVATEWRERGGR
jgi:predicted HD superfamily hydrolase involved in NAD metabolism